MMNLECPNCHSSLRMLWGRDHLPLCERCMKLQYGEHFKPADFTNEKKVVKDERYSHAEALSELEGLDKLNARMSDILNRTAIALHGGPLEMGMWSWHDLPELAEALYKKANKGFHKTSDFKSDSPDRNIPC